MIIAELARHDIASAELAHAGASIPVIALSAIIPVAAAQALAHGHTLAGGAAVPITASMELEYTAVGVGITLVASVPVVVAAQGMHGVSVAGVASVPITTMLSAVHGGSVSAAATVPVLAVQVIAHGVALDGVASIALRAAASIEIDRYEVRGEVRLGGVLIDRRVRAYLRSSGALLSQADTVAGKFALHAGFAAAECYITPIDMADGATDWLPPTANRITSVQALDVA